ncbi:MAG: beta-propeller fold lactonase family protein [Fimbriimonadales bacterium]|nr:beta-propeller fold lactonase family protein [Fimbriimonadales bacterium]
MSVITITGFCLSLGFMFQNVSPTGEARQLPMPPATTGTLIVLNKADANGSIIDLQTGDVVKTFATKEGPHEVAVSPDGKYFVVCNYGESTPGSTLTVFSLEEMRELRLIDLGEYKRPHGIEFFEAHRIVVTSETARKVVVIDAQTGRIENAIDTQGSLSHMLALSPEKKFIYTTNMSSNDMSIIHINTMETRTVKLGRQPEGIDVSPDNKEVWIGNRQDGTISVFSIEKQEVTHTLESPGFPIRVKFTPNGQRVLVSNANAGTVTVFDAATKKLEHTIAIKVPGFVAQGNQTSTQPIGILIHPNGKFAYVACSVSDAVVVLDLEKWEIAGYLKAGRVPDGLGFSPIETKRSGAE